MVSSQQILVWTCFVLCSTGDSVYGSRHRKKKSCSEVEECLKPFPMLVDLVEKDNAAALAALTYEVILDHICSQGDELKNCLDRSYCSNFEVKYTGKAIRDSLGYLCGDGKSVLLSEASCFFRDDFDRDIYQCSKTMQMETEIATLQVQTGLADSSSFCTVFSNLFKCVEGSVKRTCSDQAADFASNLIGYSVKAMAEHIGCPIRFD